MPEKKDIFSDPKFLKGCSYAKELCRINDSLNSLERSIDSTTNSYVTQTAKDVYTLDKVMKRLEKKLDNVIPTTEQLLMAQRVRLIIDGKWKGISKEELKKYT